MKLIPNSFAHSSKQMAYLVQSPPLTLCNKLIGVTLTLLLIIGIPYSLLISSPTFTKFLAYFKILFLIFLHA